MRHLAGVIVLTLAAAACAHGTPPVSRTATPPRPAPPDATSALVASAEAHLEDGLEAIEAGYLEEARHAFDRAVDAYLTAPGGAYADERRAEAFRRVLETIHVRELEALAAGDGFVETPTEPAPIDEVAEIALPEAPSEEARRAAEASVASDGSDFPVELNDAVLACIDLYQGRLRGWFGEALARGGRYMERIRAAFAAEGMPQDLAYVALVESAYKTSAYSRAHAKGVWQFISATGRRYGLEQDWWVDERSDPEKSTRAAVRYLKDLYAEFGDWNLALAGYNAGEQRVARGLRRYGVEDFWSLRKTRGLRRETKNYVPFIHAAILIAKNPELYGFDVEPEPALEWEPVAVEGAVDLRTAAECAQVSLDTLQTLNPALRRLATPVGRSFELNVPPGHGERLSSCIAGIPPERRVRFFTHAVRQGETLSGIASRYGTATAAIAAANGIRRPDRISVGLQLIIPSHAIAAKAPAVRSATRQAPSRGGERITHRIRPGDTLSTIASQYGTTVGALKAWNNLRGSRIIAGRSLSIYPKSN